MSGHSALHLLMLFIITGTLHVSLSVSYNPKVALARDVIALVGIDILFVHELLACPWLLFASDIAFSIMLVYGSCMPRLTPNTGN